MKRAVDLDHCSTCGSADLFSGFFDEDDLAFPLNVYTPAHRAKGVRWTTFCNQCGTEQSTIKPRTKETS